jgi:DNA-directed RNA polymerase subunit RPC12/RpoP
MFGFSSKNPVVIKKDFEIAFEKLRRLRDDKFNSAVKIINDDIKKNALSAGSSLVNTYFPYYEEHKTSNEKYIKNWKSIGIYEEKEAEIVAVEILYLYTKALKYAAGDLETMKYVLVRMATISQMNHDDNNEVKEKSRLEKIIINCKKCSQSLRIDDVTGWISCPKCNHKWLREKI